MEARRRSSGKPTPNTRSASKHSILPDIESSSSSCRPPVTDTSISNFHKSTKNVDTRPQMMYQPRPVRPHPIETKVDPLLQRLALRYPGKFTRHRHQQKLQENQSEAFGGPDTKGLADTRRVAGTGSKLASPLPLASHEKIDAFVCSLQGEAAALITRHLPNAVDLPPGGAFFSSTIPSHLLLSPSDRSSLGSGTTTMPFVVDDRITAETVHTLLQKGRTVASRILRDQEQRSWGNMLKKDTKPKIAKCDDLYKNIARLEPPFVEEMLQARVLTQSDDDVPKARMEVLHSSATRQTIETTPSVSNSHGLTPDKMMERSETPSMIINAAITRSTCAGDDAGIIAQVLAYVSETRRAKNAAKQTESSSVFSALDAVLSVSREFDNIRQSWPDHNARESAHTRHAIIERLTSVESSIVPQELWVAANRPTFSSSRLPEEDEEEDAAKPTNGLVFPAANPRGRAQVYLLAEALDRMIEEKPDALKILSDRSVAERLLPPDLSKDKRTNAERLLSANAIKTSEEAHLKYVDAAEHMITLIDVGLVELVRQVACMCAERGALLDSLRLVIVDLFDSCLYLVSYCKETARREAKARRDVVEASRKDVEEAIILREEVRVARRDAASLRAANMDLEVRASKFDTLMERLELRDHNFARHPPDRHLQLLMDLEENYTNSTSKGLEELYKVTQTEGDEKISDAPTTQMSQMKEAEKRAIQQDLYAESYKLLGALTHSQEAVDAACDPLYERLALPKPAMSSNVAMSRWAKIARTVGMQEADKKHRRRVFDVFTEWNIKMGMPVGAGPEFPLNRPSSGAGSSPDDVGGTPRKESAFSDISSPKPRPTSSMFSSPTTKSPTERAQPRQRNVTNDDLVAMGATDCTADEINALFDVNFDIAGYLRPTYETMPEHTVDLAEVKSMVHDVTEFLKHVSLRMMILMNSGLLRESMKPPKVPPSRPEDPCELCGRRDRVAMEKKSKGDALHRVANEIQRRYEEVVLKCQRAEAEREELRRRVQRLELSEKKQIADWARRVDELTRCNAILVEENRVLKARVSSEVASTKLGASEASADVPSSDSEGTASFASDNSAF